MKAVRALGALSDTQRAQLAELLGITCEPPKENVFQPATPPPPAPAPIAAPSAPPTREGVVQKALPGILRSINQLGALKGM